MTVRTESAIIPFESKKTECGRCGCIVIYSSDHCILCDAALEILYSVISDFGLTPEIVKKVDILDQNDDNFVPSLVGLPAMRICDELLTGLPDVDVARAAVMHAVLNGCFSDCKEDI